MPFWNQPELVKVIGLEDGLGKIALSNLEIAKQLGRIADALHVAAWSGARSLSVTAVGIPLRKESPVYTDQNRFWDKEKVKFSVTPDGAVDAAPTWAITPAVDPAVITMDVATDGLSAVVQAFTDVPGYDIVVTAPADNPSTPELESVTVTIHGSFSHSKATSLGVTAESIPLA